MNLERILIENHNPFYWWMDFEDYIKTGHKLSRGEVPYEGTNRGIRDYIANVDDVTHGQIDLIALLKEIGESNGTWLDIGCGTGRAMYEAFSNRLPPESLPQGIGITAKNDKSLARSIAEYPIKIIEAELNKRTTIPLVLRDMDLKKFSLITCFNTLMYMDFPIVMRTIGEMQNILAPGGFIFADVHQRLYENNKFIRQQHPDYDPAYYELEMNRVLRQPFEITYSEIDAYPRKAITLGFWLHNNASMPGIKSI